MCIVGMLFKLVSGNQPRKHRSYSYANVLKLRFTTPDISISSMCGSEHTSLSSISNMEDWLHHGRYYLRIMGSFSYSMENNTLNTIYYKYHRCKRCLCKAYNHNTALLRVGNAILGKHVPLG